MESTHNKFCAGSSSLSHLHLLFILLEVLLLLPLLLLLLLNHYNTNCWVSIYSQSINPILIWVIPVNGGGGIYPTLHLDSKHPPSPNQHPLLSFSTRVFHIFFGRPHLLLPLTSNSNAFLKTCPSSLLYTCLYYLTPFVFAI